MKKIIFLSLFLFFIQAGKISATSIPGDCDYNGKTTVGEVQQGVIAAMGLSPYQECLDADGNGFINVIDLQLLINTFLEVTVWE